MWKTVSRYKWLSISNKYSTNCFHILRFNHKPLKKNIHSVINPLNPFISCNNFPAIWPIYHQSFNTSAASCSNNDSDELGVEQDPDNLDDQDHILDAENPLIFSLKNILYDEQMNDDIKKLNDCENIDEVTKTCTYF